MKILTLELLKALNPCKEGLSWAINNKLIDMPLVIIDKIEGDYEGYIDWIKNALSCDLKFDKRGNLIYSKTPNNYQEWKEYDERNNLIHFRNSYGYREWMEYDGNNNLIHSRNSNHHEEWKEYDERNNLIHYRDSDNRQTWSKYDERNNVIYYRNTMDLEVRHICDYYLDGQLEVYDNLVIPYFEKP